MNSAVAAMQAVDELRYQGKRPPQLAHPSLFHSLLEQLLEEHEREVKELRLGRYTGTQSRVQRSQHSHTLGTKERRRSLSSASVDSDGVVDRDLDIVAVRTEPGGCSTFIRGTRASTALPPAPAAALPPPLPSLPGELDGGSIERAVVAVHGPRDALGEVGSLRTAASAEHSAKAMEVLNFASTEDLTDLAETAEASTGNGHGAIVRRPSGASQGSATDTKDASASEDAECTTATWTMEDIGAGSSFQLRELWKTTLPKQEIRAQSSISQNAANRHMDDLLFDKVEKYDGLMKPFISSPNSNSRLAWDCLAACMILYDMIMIPLSVFEKPEGWKTRFMDFFTLIFWTCHIFTSPTVGYVSKGTTVMTPSKICARYIRTWLLVDLVCVVPDWIFTLAAVGSSNDQWVRLLRIMRLARIVRLLRLFKLRWIWVRVNDKLDSESSSIVVNIFNMIFILLLVNHIVACFWYLISDLQRNGSAKRTWVIEFEMDDEPWEYRYMTAFHWSITQFTPASMDVQPRNMAERTYANGVIVFALLGFSYLVGSITGSLTQLRSMNEEGTKAFWSLRRYLRQNNVPTSLSIRVQKYLEHAWENARSSKDAMDVKIIRLLSEQLYNELLYSITAPHMEVHPLYKHLNNMSEVTMHRLATKAITRKHIARSDMLFFAQETATHMVFVQTGSLEYVRIRRGKVSGSEMVEAQEDWICEQVLWIPNWVHLGNLVSLTHSVLLMVDGMVFGDAIKLNPQVFTVVKDYAVKFVEWINGLERSQLSDITQGDEMSVQLKGFIMQGEQSRKSEAPYLKRMKTASMLSASSAGAASGSGLQLDP